MVATGCGSNGSKSSPPSIALQIITQPANQTIPLGQTATFTVSATGTGTLTYQWSENGTPISGATSTTYTTPATVLADSGSKFTVAVSDPTSSTTSSQALLTIGPRSPAAGDLRFQQVDSAETAASAHGLLNESTDESYDQGSHGVATYSDYVGSPLELAPAYYNCNPAPAVICTWSYFVTELPPTNQIQGLIYTSGSFSNFNSDVLALSTQNSLEALPETGYVVTSLDFPSSSGAYALAANYSGQNAGFDLQQEIVSPGAVEATAAADGLKSRVITAVSFDDAGQAYLLSYGWQGDTTTTYDVTTLTVAPEDVAASATTLAQQGYIITAFGGNDSIGYVLVGTKVQGDTLPRPILTPTQASGPQAPGYANGYAPVGFVQYQGPQDPAGTAPSFTVLYEE